MLYSELHTHGPVYVFVTDQIGSMRTKVFWTRRQNQRNNIVYMYGLPNFHSFPTTTTTTTFKYTVKKGSRVSRPQPGCHYQTLPGRE
jgi:hypothetical protein